MALTAEIKIERPGFNGQLTADAYWRVASIRGHKEAIRYTMEAIVDGNRVDSAEYAFEPDLSPESPNFIAQAYAHAKTLELLADSTDA